MARGKVAWRHQLSELGVKRYGTATIRYASQDVFDDTLHISIHIIYATSIYTEISQQQPKDNRVYYIQTKCILINFSVSRYISWWVYHDISRYRVYRFTPSQNIFYPETRNVTSTKRVNEVWTATECSLNKLKTLRYTRAMALICTLESGPLYS